MIRSWQRRDAPAILELMRGGFPEEERLFGTRPDGFLRIVDRQFGLGTRAVVGALALFGRPVYRFLVVEEDGRAVATTIVTFLPRAAYLSMVAVAEPYRRRGHARALLERARAIARRYGKPFLALDVLTENAPARALYERAGYRPLRRIGLFVREGTEPPPPPARPPRPYRPSDHRALVDGARRQLPAAVAEVLPFPESGVGIGRVVDRALDSRSSAWVVPGPAGPLGYLQATVSDAMTAGHVRLLALDGAEPTALVDAVGEGVRWAYERGVRRLVAEVPDHAGLARDALGAAGFTLAHELQTLVRPTSSA